MAKIHHRFARCKILCIATTVARWEDSCNPGIECVVYRCHFRTTNPIGNCTRKLGFMFVDDMQDIGEVLTSSEFLVLLRGFQYNYTLPMPGR
jgi:hypothetical protein